MRVFINRNAKLYYVDIDPKVYKYLESKKQKDELLTDPEIRKTGIVDIFPYKKSKN